MRVLWFTNTPSLGANYLNNKAVGGGWIESLEAALTKKPGIKQAISFNLENNNVEPFTVNNTEYYPINISTPKSKIRKLVSYWRKSIKNENDIRSYLDVIENFKPDIVHIFGTEAAYGLIISKIKVPCVIHIQGNLTVSNLKWYSGIPSVDILRHSKKRYLLKGTGLYHDFFLSKKRAVREREIMAQCKYFMGRTDWDRRISSVLSPQSKYYHCDEIIRPKFYLHQWSALGKRDNFTIFTTIRNNIYKGLETVHQCKEILKSINFRSKIIWKIAGITETDEIFDVLEKKYKSTFQEINIQLLGHLGEMQLVTEMLNSDLFIHPSHIDNSPNSLCEAMLLGMPAIATFAGGIPSILENRKEGLLVQDGDPYALAGAIIELMNNRDLATEFGNNARTKALERHCPEKIVNNLLSIYSSIIGQ